MSKYSRVEQFLEAGEKYHLADYPAEERDDEIEEGEEQNGFLSTLWSRRERGILSTKSLWCRTNWKWILLHLVLLSLWATLYTTTLFIPISNRIPSLVSNPLQATMEYEKYRFELLAIYRHDGDLNPHKTNSFNGPPRPELEEAWDELTQYRNVRVSLEELGDVEDEESLVKLTDGSGYYVTLSAFHGFHCIRRLHQYLYAEHYYPGLSEFEKFMLLRHTEHCLDWLRQYVQCNADLSLIPLHWITTNAGPVAPDNDNRQCIVWERVEEWMADHTFDPHEPGLLVHPILGDPFTNDGPALGVTELGNGSLLHQHGSKAMPLI